MTSAFTGATCTEDAYTIYTATYDGHTDTNTVTSENSAAGHDYKAEVTDPTCTAGGYTTYTCSRCGDTYTANATEALGHTPGEAVIENEDAATCTKAGSYEEVVYCAVCDTELSRVTKGIEKIAHTPGDAVIENRTEASCTVPGSYDSVIYCTVCGAELERESGIVIPATGHTPGEAVRENVADPTCTAEGSYDEVVYCAVCGEEMTREAKSIEKKAHTPGAEVRENEIAPDCVNAGSYESVFTCTVCGNEISRETVEIPALGHDWSDWQTVTAPAVGVPGTARRICFRCNEVETKEIPALDAPKDRVVQFVVSGSMHYVVHMPDVNYEIYSKQTPAIYWYEGEDLSFDIVLHPDCKYENYVVTLNDVELGQNPDGTYTIPGGTDYVKINVNPVTTTDNGGSGSHTSTGGVCKYCGKVHPGNLWGMIVAFFHAIFYFFKHLFG